MAAEVIDLNKSPEVGFKVTLPDKEHQQKYHTHKYRAFGNSMYINFYGIKGYTITLRYKDIVKLKERTSHNNTKLFESLHITSFEKNLVVSNNNGGKSPKTQFFSHSARLKYSDTAKIMLIEESSIHTLYNNEGKSDRENIPAFGIILTFVEFNDVMSKVEAVSQELQCLSLSQEQIENDLD